MKKSTITHTTIALTVIVLTTGVTLVSCAINDAIKSIDRSLDSTLGGGQKYAPKVYVSDNLIEKEADHTWEVTDQASWNAAVSGINNAGEGKKHIVNVKNSFSTPNSLYTAAFYITATNIAVVFEGNATISFSPAGRTISLFEVKNGQAIIVRDIKLRGNGNNTGPLVSVWEGGKFIMEGSALVSGNTAKGKSGKIGGICSYTSSPGGVYVSGIFIMKDNASVSGNTSSGRGCSERGSGQGGGVEVSRGGTFTMQDNASVTGNTAAEYGGGVSIFGGTFTMQDNASVTGNTADIGGGVYVNGLFTMKDNAKVSGNTARIDSDVYRLGSQNLKN